MGEVRSPCGSCGGLSVRGSRGCGCRLELIDLAGKRLARARMCVCLNSLDQRAQAQSRERIPRARSGLRQAS